MGELICCSQVAVRGQFSYFRWGYTKNNPHYVDI